MQKFFKYFLLALGNQLYYNIGNEYGGIHMVKRNIIIAKAGGTAGKNSVNYKISLPAEMVKELNITQEDKSVIVSCVDGKIIIEKDKG